MKLALISHTVYPDFIGGREHHVHNLARILAETHDVIVIGGGRVKQLTERKIAGYRLLLLPTKQVVVSKNPLQIFRFFSRLTDVLEKENPDVVHAFEYGSQSTHLAYVYAEKRNRPFFLTIHGYTLSNPILKFIKAAYNFLFGRNILKKTQKIFCVSKLQYDEMLKICPTLSFHDNIQLLENSILLDDFKNNELPLDAVSLENPIRLLSVMRILPRKNAKIIVLAIDKIINENKIKNIELTLVGPDCGDLPNVKRLVSKLGLWKYVKLTGAVPYEEVKNFMFSCDIFILPSSYEGLPLALLEAMACGKAIIVSRLASTNKIIDDGIDGILIKPGDTSELSKAIVRLMKDNTLRNQMGLNAKNKAALFNSRIETQKINTVYSQSLGFI